MTGPEDLGRDPPAFSVLRPDGASSFFLVCDHAGRRIPRGLTNLGLAAADLESHIAWDIGALGLAACLSQALDAILVAQTYSRLVIDCNRPPGSAESIVARSAGVPVPGNGELSAAEVQARADTIFHPYHDRIRQEVSRRQYESQPTILVALHSFTPVFAGRSREWHAGVLALRDRRMADPMLLLLREERTLVVGDNEPYAASELTDFTIVHHAEQRGAPYIELEVRQDLIADEGGREEWAERFARLLVRASATFHF
ncbi:MAG TPA: N-formylglutamate amidohydrolase [Polyangiaceae bacterium]|nr:N-formylglutamate amidohydrolase [Polyangiaceae bacterium]